MIMLVQTFSVVLDLSLGTGKFSRISEPDAEGSGALAGSQSMVVLCLDPSGLMLRPGVCPVPDLQTSDRKEKYNSWAISKDAIF